MYYSLIVSFLLFIGAIPPSEEVEEHFIDSEICLSEEEMKLLKQFNAYRVSKKLPKIAISASMTKVAQAHAQDLDEYFDYQPGAECNMHSWSENGDWSSCCYTRDHKQAQCMWGKPQEIAGFDAIGYENAHYSSAGATADTALDGWKKSPGHHAVMINLDQWKKVEWKSVGIGIRGKYAVMWFAEKPDPVMASTCK